MEFNFLPGLTTFRVFPDSPLSYALEQTGTNPRTARIIATCGDRITEVLRDCMHVSLGDVVQNDKQWFHSFAKKANFFTSAWREKRVGY